MNSYKKHGYTGNNINNNQVLMALHQRAYRDAEKSGAKFLIDVDGVVVEVTTKLDSRTVNWICWLPEVERAYVSGFQHGYAGLRNAIRHGISVRRNDIAREISWKAEQEKARQARIAKHEEKQQRRTRSLH